MLAARRADAFWAERISSGKDCRLAEFARPSVCGNYWDTLRHHRPLERNVQRKSTCGSQAEPIPFGGGKDLAMKIFFGFVASVLGFFIVMVTLYVLFVIHVNIINCVVLPDGSMIRHASVINREYGDRLNMVLTDEAGKPLVRTDDFLFFSRHPTNSNLVVIKRGNVHLEMDGREMMPLILDEFDGFFSEPRQWYEPRHGDQNDYGIGAIGIVNVYRALMRSRKFKSVSCDVPWFDPED